MEKKETVAVGCTRNERGVSVKMCCVSCALKKITPVGKRICSLSDEKVDALDYCPEWLMDEGLRHAGRNRGGLVRDRDTKEIIIK